MKELWVEKYRPSTIDGYVFRDNHQREQVKTWIKEKSIPHLLFSGSAGIGKTTLAIAAAKTMEFDALEINAALESSFARYSSLLSTGKGEGGIAFAG